MKKIAMPVTLSTLLMGAYIALQWMRPPWLTERVDRVLLAAWLVSVSVLLSRAINYMLLDVTFARLKGREAPALLHGLLSLVIYSIFCALIFSQVLHQDLSSIAATSAVVTIVLGLALQDTMGNFFAGISIHIEQPFHIGDTIKLGEMLGRVEAVTWRTTAIRTNDNTVIVFPNSKVAREPLEIFPLGHLNRRSLRFPAPYEVPPQQVTPLIQAAVQSLRDIAPERPPTVRLAAFADSAHTYEVLYWVKDYMLVADLDAMIRERVWYVYQRHQITHPYPHLQVLYDRGQDAPTLPIPAADYQRALERVSLFEPLTAQERAHVAAHVKPAVYAPGEIILQRGDPGDSMFIIQRGRAEVRRRDNNGAQPRVAELHAGDFFGEMALFTGAPRAADVCAVDEVVLLEICKASLEPLLARNASLAEAFSRKIAERQAHLAEHSQQPVVEEEIAPETILRRMQRFFSLS